MELKSVLQSDLKEAMRQGDETRKNTLRMVLSAMKLAEVEKRAQLVETASLAEVEKGAQQDESASMTEVEKGAQLDETASLAEVEKGSQLDETASLAVIQKEIKNRREAIADAERAHRPELITQNEQEIKLLQPYVKMLQRSLHLPEDLSQDELDALVKAVISEVGATSIREMGQVMKILIPRLEGRAPNDQASQVVRKLLQ